MSLLLERRKKLSDVPTDQMYVIFGEPGSGKTALSSTFPKSEDEKLLLIDFNEGGTASIPSEYEDMIDVVPVYTFEEFDNVFTDIYNGYTTDDKGTKVELKYQTIVFDTVTMMEYMLKQRLMGENDKKRMTLQLWGSSKDEQEGIYNLLRELHSRTGSVIVATAHVMKIEDDKGFEIRLPALQRSASRFLAAKASYVWYTKLEDVEEIDEETNTSVTVQKYNTYIEGQPGLATKCRKPPKFTGKIPAKIQNLTYPKFEKHVLNKIRGGNK